MLVNYLEILKNVLLDTMCKKLSRVNYFASKTNFLSLHLTTNIFRGKFKKRTGDYLCADTGTINMVEIYSVKILYQGLVEKQINRDCLC